MSLLAHARSAKAVLPALLVVAASALAGCGSPGQPATDPSLQARVAALRWTTMTVHTTAAEPFEAQGPIQVTWADGTAAGAFALWAAREADLHRRTVVLDGVAYTTDFDMGWTRGSLDAGLSSSRFSNRLALWDVPAWIASPGVTLREAGPGEAGVVGAGVLNVTADGMVAVGGLSLEVHAQVVATAGQVVSVRLRAPQARESPFTFRADGTAFPFAAAAPGVALASEAVAAGNDQAQSAHVTVLQALQDYVRDHAGAVPDTPSADSLKVELLAQGHAWPTNAFTGQALAVGKASGDAGWAKCAANDAYYTGWGWDGALITQAFGKGCQSGVAP